MDGSLYATWNGMESYLGGLLEWLLVNGNEDDCVWALSVLGGGLHVLDDVVALHEIDESIGTEVFTKLLLVITSVNADGTETHGLGVLLSERSESTTSTDNGDGLTWLSTRLLQPLVDGDTGTWNWLLVCRSERRYVIRDHLQRTGETSSRSMSL